MSQLWVQAVGHTASGVEDVPTAGLGEAMYRRAWGHPEHPAMAALLDKIRSDGGYDPQRHGMLQVKVGADGGMSDVSLPREHHIPGFGDNSGHALAFALGHLGHETVPAHVTRREAPSPELDATRAPVYYHGTTTGRDLHEITPASQHGRDTVHRITDPGYAYATPVLDNAWHWAEKSWDNQGGRLRVFRVRPRGPVELDPRYDEHGNSRDNFEHDVRSRHGFDVLGEEPMPEHLRHYLED